MDENFPLCYVISSNNLFARTLVERLEKEKCRVIVISNESDFYKYIENSSYKPAYLFYIEGFNEKFFLTPSKYKTLVSFVKDFKPKAQFVFPYIINGKRARIERLAKTALDSKINICYLGDVYGVGMELSGSYISRIFKGIYERREVNVPAFDFELYSVSAKAAVNALLRSFLSYGFGKKEVVISRKISFFKFLSDIRAGDQNILYEPNSALKPVSTISNFDFVKVNDDGELSESIRWILSNRKKTRKKIKVKIKLAARLRIFVIILFLVLLTPFLSLFISVFSMRQGFNSLLGYNINGARFYFGVSKATSTVSNYAFYFWNEPKRVSKIVWSFADVGNEVINSLVLAKKLTDNISGEQPYDVNLQSSSLYLSLDDLYKKISFLEADKNEFKDLGLFLPSNFDLGRVGEEISGVKNVIKDLPSILGSEKQRTYLVLLQDNQEIRATGGKINSFGVFTFDAGKLVSKNFYKTSDVDSQLKGYTVPPGPIQKYLGLNNWGMGDSNWDPDFKMSALKAEWFLKNEVGIDASGALGADANIYKEMEGFNGNFLQAMNFIFKNLQTKNLQMYSNNEDVEAAINKVDWGGGVKSMACEGNCLPITTGIVEDNLGKNRINSDVTRSVNVNIDLTGIKLLVKVNVNIANSSKETYKVYVRVIAPKGANINYPDGVYVEVPAFGSKEVNFSWSILNSMDYTRDGKLLYYFRKQPGVDGSLTTDFNFPSGLTGRVTSRYNTGLVRDFEKEIDF